MKTTVISEDIKFEGNIEYDSNLIIKGKVKGKIKSEGSLQIEEKAEVNADIQVKNIIISGSVQGNITNSELVSINKTSSIRGDIHSNLIEMQKGAKIVGNIVIQ